MTKKRPITAKDPRTNMSAPLPGIDTKPLPLAGKTPPPPYPIEALGDLLGNAATALAHHVQTPLGMAAQTVLAVAALVVQGHANVKKGNIGTSPTTLYCLTIADSGERKSSLDSLAMKPIYEYQAERRTEYEALLAEYRADVEAHELRYRSTLNSYRGSGKKPVPLRHDQQQALSTELAELEKKRPTPPPRPHILMEEPTAEGIYKHFLDARAIAGLFSDEGGAFFSGHGMTDESKGRSITMLSQLWDGKPITRTRAGAGESGVLVGRRLAAHLMVQPVFADKIFSDQLLSRQGFLARFLVSSEQSLVGSRLLAKRSQDEGADSDPAVTRFWEAVAELIRQPLPTNDRGELEPEILAITGPAYKAWVDVHDAIEDQLSPHGELSVIRAFAAKAADNTARIAAILAYIETHSAPAPGHIDRAAKIIDYYLNTMIQRTQEATHSTLEHEARELADWIKRHGGELHADSFNKLPAPYRKAQKARSLLGLLVDYGYVVITVSGPNGKPRAWKLREGLDDV